MTAKKQGSTHSPVFEKLDMGVTDALRFLKGGFETPVRETIAQHVEHDNEAQVELEAARALQMQGHHMMGWHMAEADVLPSLVDEATLAAYLDGALEPAELAAFEAQLSSSQAAYRQMAATQWETCTPPPAGLAAPASAVSAIKRVGTTTAVEQPVTVSLWERVQKWVRGRERAWQGPALGFALGALAVFAMFGGWPQAEMTIVMPGMVDPTEDIGIMMSGDADSTLPVIELTTGVSTLLQWPPIEGATYTVEVVQGDEVVYSEATSEQTWRLDSAEVDTNADLTVTVQAIYPNGSVLPVSNVRFVWTP